MIARIKQGVIEEKIPLKQGLKLAFCCVTVAESANWREDSIKTRIETWKDARNWCTIRIEEKIPLKQGLKHWCIQEIRATQSYWREDSIKTRIETPYSQ